MIRSMVMVLAVVVAPMQCGHESDAAHCWDDTPGDGLWDLAGKFRDAHDDDAAKRTLAYLVERYPSSRWAPAARDALAGKEQADGSAKTK